MRKIILTIFVLFFILINLRNFIINTGFFNVYDYSNDDLLISEINKYIEDDLFKKTDSREPLYSSYQNYPFLNKNVIYAEKLNDGVLFLLKASGQVSEYIYYCYTCNFDSYSYTWGFSNHIMRDDYNYNITKINDNIYHAFSPAPLFDYNDESFQVF